MSADTHTLGDRTEHPLKPLRAVTRTLHHGYWEQQIDAAVLAELEQIQAIQDHLLEGVWLGKTAALATADAEPRWAHTPLGQARYTALGGMDLQYVSDNPRRLGADGLPLAWSCWDISLALSCRLREVGGYRYAAGPGHLQPAEVGNVAEPHAAVKIRSRATGRYYLADPYFGAGPMIIADNLTATFSSAVATATFTGADTICFTNGERLTVQNVAYPAAYEYDVIRAGGAVDANTLASAAPGWAAARGMRIMRSTVGDLCIRITELDASTTNRRGMPAGTTEVKVWDLTAGVGAAPAWRWTGPSWHETATAAVDLFTQVAGSVNALSALVPAHAA